MNKDIIQGNWAQLKGKALKMWGKIIDYDRNILDGREEELIGRLQERYGWARLEAERRVTADPTEEHVKPTRH